MPRKKPEPSPLAGLAAEISLERNGAKISICNVPAEASFSVLVEMLDGMRLAVKKYPELIPELGAVGGGSIPYTDDEEAEAKRCGFR